MGPSCQFAKSDPLSWQQCRLFGDIHGTPLANNSIECKPVLLLEPSFGDKRWSVGLHCHHYETSLRLPSYILWSVHYRRFLYYFSNVIQFQLSLPIFPYSALFPSSSQLDLPIPKPRLQSTHNICFLLPERSMCLPYSLLLCLTWQYLWIIGWLSFI